MNHDSPAPYGNCAFTHCDLPGQCRREGKCHHPKKMEHTEAGRETQPVATVMDLRIATFNRLVYDEGVDKDALLYLAKVITKQPDASLLAEVSALLETARARIGTTPFTSGDSDEIALWQRYKQAQITIDAMRQGVTP